MVETKRLANYTLEIVDVAEFRDYLNKNESNFSTPAMNAFLKALDIPPKFFREQPQSTQDELLSNREVFVRETKKFFNKVIVVVTYQKDIDEVIVDKRILGAARLDRAEAEAYYERLRDIDEIPTKFEHRSFVKDGYISIIVSNGIEKNRDNQVLAVDFPINLNKKPIIHEAIYTLPNESSTAPIEHIWYNSSEEIELGVDYNTIKEAIDDKVSFIDGEFDREAKKDILRETELVAIALRELGTIPKSYTEKIGAYISEHVTDNLDTEKLESLVLDFDETVKGYKQVTALRTVSGHAVIEFLNSDQFKEIQELMEEDLAIV